jgi:opacity protein-like surface antigen
MKKLFTVLFTVIIFTGFVNAQNNMYLGVGPLVSLPIGSFGDAANVGFGGTAIFELEFMPQLHGTAQAGYITWGTDADDLSFSGIPILVGAKYYFMQSGGVYGHGQLGVTLLTFDYPEIVTPFGSFGGSQSSTEFSFVIGAGYEVQASESVIVDLGAAFNLVSNANHLTFRVGAKFGL